MNATSVEWAAPSGQGAEAAPAALIDPRGEAPIRADRLGLDGLDARAAQLASACQIAPHRRAPSPLLRRFVENKKVLEDVHRRLVAVGDRRRLPGIDAEWLVDNFHIIADSLREVRRDLPPGYDALLPKLEAAPMAGYPRVHALAMALVAHSDSDLDEARIARFVRAFQEVAPLTIGELWALPTMLRLVLLENLRRLADRMMFGWEERRRAERWAADVVARIRARAARANDPPAHVDDNTLPDFGGLSDPFVVQLLRILRDQEGSADVLDRLESALSARGSDPNEVLRREHHDQAANQVTVGNAVLSLRLLSAVDWNAFFEQCSRVEAILRDDPSGVYPLQDFPTSDRYRRIVEAISRGSGADEVEVARFAIDLARRARQDSADASPKDHVGYYLIDRGRRDLEAHFGYKPGLWPRLLGAMLDHPSATYFGSIGLALAFFVTAAIGLVVGAGTGWGWLLLAVAVVLLPLSELAVGLVNHKLTLFLPPRVLPKLDFKEGIPAEHMAFVVIPGMLARHSSAAVLIERMETHYLSNPDPNLRFALLTDFSDAPAEFMPDDEAFLRDAIDRIRILNDRHRAGDPLGRTSTSGGDHPTGPDRFFLFHRKRLWNPSQGVWMGWERKRGKLQEFNRMLRGARDTSYTTFSVDPSELPQVRYVITLDADTRMPRDAAGRLVGAMAHALNRPKFDPKAGRVVSGYGVLQPRVSFHLTAATRSRFAAMLATSGGIDPYSTAASDSYMDLYGIGTFTGKGIYDVDAFEAATAHAFPENAILSHDLIEGNFSRCGLLSDTELFDDFPARYNAYSRREHRWVRGDWQLLPWLAPRVPTSEGPSARRPNPLPALERWKLLDNLRRSLVPPALLVLLVLGWTLLPGSPWAWTILGVLVLSVPLWQVAMSIAVAIPRQGLLSPLRAARETVPAMVGQIFMELVLLAYRSSVLVDAIARTLARLYVSRKKLLEWETAASTEQRLGTDLRHFIQGMWTGPTLALAIGAIVAVVRPDALPAASPILLAWLISPGWAYFLSRPPAVERTVLTDDERKALRRVARKTWLFFETFVGDEDNWLPPDNFQEYPDGRIAHRTSPTNKGLLLLSTLSAADFGYIGPFRLVDRLEKTLRTLQKLEKHWGHILNWYDTKTLQPLTPRYVSTVDSGNLLGCLVTLSHGLREKATAPILDASIARGLEDAFRLATESPSAPREPARRLASLFAGPIPADLAQWDEWLASVETAARDLAARTSRATDSPTTWADRLVEQTTGWRAELASLAPWITGLIAIENRSHALFPSDDDARRWSSIRAELLAPSPLRVIAERSDRIASELETLAERARTPSMVETLRALIAAVRDPVPGEVLTRLHQAADAARDLAAGMDFRPLYRTDRQLFSIGYNLTEGRLDSACYDLLASEASLTCYLAVARGEAPRKHWFQLGRPFIRAAGRLGLISWGGTMFEYLMPRLMLRTLPGTTLAEACKTAVARQIEYGRELGLPWGISESSYGEQNIAGDYHYQAFGTPGLGLKQGLELDRVFAPYATMMAVMLAPREALENLRHLTREGAEGEYGYYEAIDYTPGRVPEGKRSVVVQSYMAHHQGMGLVALNNALHADVMTHRFSAEPMVRAIDLLLEERLPADPPILERALTAAEAAAELRDEGESAAEESAEGAAPSAPTAAPMSRRLTTPFTPAPRTHILSNGQYHVLLTNAGSGVSTCRGLDITRWREDAAKEGHGSFLYIRDVGKGSAWSAGFQPTCRVPESFEAIFAADKASFRRRDYGIETTLEVIVSPEHRAEVRRLTLVNHDASPREIEVTSYAEIVLAPRASDVVHPAFSKLFVETEWLGGPGAILARRRMRSASEEPLWAVHVSAVDRATRGGTAIGPIQFETDRARFLGRGRTVANPAAVDTGATLSGTAGPVLDPVLSLRRRVKLEAGGTAVLSFVTAFAESRDEALGIADQFREIAASTRAFELAWARIQVEHRHQDQSGSEAHLYQRLAAHVVFAGGALRGDPSAIQRNQLGQPALWRFGISGDRPIVLARIGEGGELHLARQLVAAHAYLTARGLDFDLVLIDQQAGSYLDAMNRQLLDAVRAGGSADRLDKPGGVFVRRSSQMTEEERTLLEATARVVLVGDRGPLSTQLDRTEHHAPAPPRLNPTRDPVVPHDEPVRLPDDLLFANGTGGFTPDGREYCILVEGSPPPSAGRNGPLAHGPSPYPAPASHLRLPPAPWANVVANATAGFVATESGPGFTWSANSQGNRLTPWSNDPVSDPPGEAIYLRDEETGEVWSPTPLPIAGPEPTLVRHGQGYTSYQKVAHGIEHELTLFVPPDDPVKLFRLRLRASGESGPRRISATFYAEWVLGPNRDASSMHVVTEIDEETGALLARNAYRIDLADRVAFADVDRRPRSLTTDRLVFLGRHGSLSTPAALTRAGLAEQLGAGFDPCAAIQVQIDLRPGAWSEIVFLLGEADNLESARAVVRRHRERGRADQTLTEVRENWDRILGTVHIRTPDASIDLLANRWLLYQVLSCRYLGRSGFYQSGGAFGFRDQLQDVMAMVHAAPEVARAHILRAAAHQFLEGDVQHWWHPPVGRGIRTRISDDPAWLGLAASHYVEVTGDASLLDEPVDFLSAPPLKPGQEDDYGLPDPAHKPASLYDHILKGLDRVDRLGPHGLPLIGHGDWNDGMNRVGAEGKGESVWLAWFAATVFRRIATIADSRGDATKAAHLRQRADAFTSACESTAWDGEWYRRAYFDNGTPLGSSSNPACQIDSLPQSWAVLAGSANPDRARRAMESVDRLLVDREGRLILLFTPPFDAEPMDPGYIKGYVPGIRENGGQYTHAATWVIQAFAALGEGRRAFELLSLINPIRHADDPASVERYKVEPYVVAGDVYGRPPHVGRGGWTWYTGSASWLYRTIVESILGLKRQGDRLTIEPRIPPDWTGFSIAYRYGSTTYRMEIANPRGVESGTTEMHLDGRPLPDRMIPLIDDGRNHEVRISM